LKPPRLQAFDRLAALRFLTGGFMSPFPQRERRAHRVPMNKLNLVFGTAESEINCRFSSQKYSRGGPIMLTRRLTRPARRPALK
jgi:hypothetical protein